MEYVFYLQFQNRGRLTDIQPQPQEDGFEGELGDNGHGGGAAAGGNAVEDGGGGGGGGRRTQCQDEDERLRKVKKPRKMQQVWLKADFSSPPAKYNRKFCSSELRVDNFHTGYF